jgi:FKBP-type peptidyl-prolyl cis-trans isomerase FkpA
MRKFAAVLLGVLVIMSACNKGKEKETPNGFKYTLIKEGDGVPGKKHEYIVYNLMTKDSKDSVWSDTYEKGFPGIFVVQDSANIDKEDGFMQLFRLVSKGDSISFTIPVPKLFKDYAKMPIPPGVDSTLSITYLVKIEDIMDEPKLRNYQADMMLKKKTRQKTEDETLIKEFLAKNNTQAERDTSGIYYTIHQANGKEKPTSTNCVTVSYKGSLLEDGSVFDQNPSISFSLQQVIPGWRIAIPKLGIGDSATFYIPSDLAYGSRGAQGAIPPDAVLIFNVRLKEKGNEVDPKTGNCK